MEGDGGQTSTVAAVGPKEEAQVSGETMNVDSEEETDLMGTTSSSVKLRINRARTSSHWICTVQLMDVEIVNSNCENDEPRFLEDEEVSKVDAHIKQFVEEYYNKEGHELRSTNNEILWVVGSKLVYHCKQKLVVGVLIVRSPEETKSLSLNAHLRLEKQPPLSPLIFEDYHKIVFGDAYPIHLEDEVCIQGNSLRSLLLTWATEEFFDSLHWIIFPTKDDDVNSKVLNTLSTTLLSMKQLVLSSPRKSLMQTPTVLATPKKNKRIKNCRRSLDKDFDNPKITAYFQHITKKEESVSAWWWDDWLPMNQENLPDMHVHHRVTQIKNNGGTVIRVSMRDNSH